MAYSVQGGSSRCHNDHYEIGEGPAPTSSVEPGGNQYYGGEILDYVHHQCCLGQVPNSRACLPFLS